MIPATIPAAIASLQTAVNTAAPLARSSTLIIKALQKQGDALVDLVDATLLASAGGLDGPDLSGMPPLLVSGLLGLLNAAQTQAQLSAMRGFVGRAASNLEAAGY